MLPAGESVASLSASTVIPPCLLATSTTIGNNRITKLCCGLHSVQSSLVDHPSAVSTSLSVFHIFCHVCLHVSVGQKIRDIMITMHRRTKHVITRQLSVNLDHFFRI